MFRFEKNDIERLMGLIDWPAVGQFRGPQRHVYHPLECLLACMRKLSQPINLFDLCRGADDLPARDEGSPIALSLHQSDCHTEKPQVRDMILYQTVTYFSRETGIGHEKL